MSTLYEKSLVKLELPLVLEQLAACAGSQAVRKPACACGLHLIWKM